MWRWADESRLWNHHRNRQQVGAADVAPFEMKTRSRVQVEMAESTLSVRIRDAGPKPFAASVLRKICFGGLYERLEWPIGMKWASEVRVKVESIEVE